MLTYLLLFLAWYAIGHCVVILVTYMNGDIPSLLEPSPESCVTAFAASLLWPFMLAFLIADNWEGILKGVLTPLCRAYLFTFTFFLPRKPE